jgi:Zn-finger nucleic acid-binding protein
MIKLTQGELEHILKKEAQGYTVQFNEMTEKEYQSVIKQIKDYKKNKVRKNNLLKDKLKGV